MALNFTYNIIDTLFQFFLFNGIVHLMCNIFLLFLPCFNSLNRPFSFQFLSLHIKTCITHD